MNTEHAKRFLDGFYKAFLVLTALVVSAGTLTALVKAFMPQIELTALMALIGAAAYYYSDKIDSEELFRNVDQFMGVESPNLQNQVSSGLGGRQRRIYTYG